MSREKVTIYDVAEELGISIATVNRALNGKPNVSPETKRLVVDAARQMGYKPSKAAASLSRNPKRIAVLMMSTIMGFVAEVKRGIMKAYNDLKDFGLEVDIIEVVGDEDVDAEYIRRLDEIADEGYDGIIMLPGNESAIAQRLKQPGYGGKTVFAAVVSDIVGSKCLFSVRNNGCAAGRMAAELLGMMTKNSKKVALVTGRNELFVHSETINGFKAMVDESGLEFVGVYEHYDKPSIAYKLADKLMNDVPDLGGIYFSSANSVTFCKRLIELGKISDIEIVTSDIFPEIEMLMRDGNIGATIFQNPFNQGKLVTRYMFEHLAEGRQFEDRNILLNPEIVLKSNIEFYSKNIEYVKYDMFI